MTTTVLVYRKYVRHQRLLSSLENERSPGEEGQQEQVLSISLQCNCQELGEKDNAASDSLEQSLIQF